MSSFSKTEHLLKLNEDGQEASPADKLLAYIELDQYHYRLKEELGDIIDDIGRQQNDKAHGCFKDFYIKHGDEPEIVLKLEANDSCSCHPEYEVSEYPFPASVITENGESWEKYFAFKREQEEEAKRRRDEAEKAHQARVAAAQRRREEEEFERLKKKLGK